VLVTHCAPHPHRAGLSIFALPLEVPDKSFLEQRRDNRSRPQQLTALFWAVGDGFIGGVEQEP
jgi:hypothetical protein